MESSHSIGHVAHRTEDDYPGCMGGLVHLFDFNQALVGRKLLTDKISGAGDAATENGSESSIRAEISKLNTVKSRDAQFRHQSPAEMPVKAQVARDSSKDSNARDRTPNVVARLMGLEALPTHSKTAQKTSACKAKETFPHKSTTAQGHDEKLPRSAMISLKKEKARNIPKGEMDDPGTLPFQNRNHPQEQQLQEFKKDFEAWQRQKLGHSRRPARNNNSVSHTTDKHVLSQKMHEISQSGDQGISRIIKSHERLDESREFMDAMNFLQSNHELFAKFIEDSKCLLPWRGPESGDNNIVLPYPSRVKNARNLHSASDESYRVQPFTGSSSLQRRYGFDAENVSAKEVGVDSNRLSAPKSQLECRDRAFDLQGYSRYADLSQMYDTNYQVPTRIVVLKPSPGRVRDRKSASSTYARPMKDHVVESAVIEKLRENLRNIKEYSNERTGARLTSDEVGSKNPRQIAREIAREVRESIKGNRMMKSMNGLVTADNGEYPNRKNNNANDFGDSVCSSDREDCTPINRPSHESNDMRLFGDKKFSLETGKERRKQASHLTTKNVKDNSNENISKVNSMNLRNEVCHDNTSCQTSPAVGGGRYSLDGMGSSQKYRRALFHSHARINKDCLQSSSNYDSDCSDNKIHMGENDMRFLAYDHLETVDCTLGQETSQPIDEMKSIKLVIKSDFSQPASNLGVSLNALEVDEVLLENEVTAQKELHVTYEKQLSPIDNDVIINSCFTFSPSGMAAMRENDKAIDLLGAVDPSCEVAREIERDCSSQAIKNNIKEGSFEKSDELCFSLDNNGAKSDQPSPVSVFDLPCQEESSLSRERDEIKCELQDTGTADCAHLQLYSHHHKHGMELDKGFFVLPGTGKENIDFMKDDLAFSDLFLEEVAWPTGREAEMLYAKDVLLASGFIKHITSLPASSYVLHDGLSLGLFEEMENCYIERSNDYRTVETLDVCQRQFIFDSVSEALSNILQLICNKSTSLWPPTNIDVFKHTWSYIHQLLCAHSESQDTLENLVVKDLEKKGQWLNIHLEVEALRHEIEGAILDDLIEEMLLVM